MRDMLPGELERCIAEKPAAILPFGTIEWHSYHLPVGLDTIKADVLCERLATMTGAILLPSTSWAVGGVPFPYTFRFDLELFESLANNILVQLAAMGLRVVVALTGHYGLEQTLALKRAALRAMRQTPLTIFAGGEFEVVTELGYHGDHAAKWETSLLWSMRPELVHLQQVDANAPLDGIIGDDPRQSASPELGEKTAEAITTRLAELTEQFLSATTAVQRAQYVQAVAAGVRVLEAIWVERQVKPKSQAPPIATPSYLQYLSALYRGDYAEALQSAESKLFDLRA
ncbi:MAG: creatininase family protein [Chloroflexi bacterium]|nr:creatininase family protein [Chloroflexota bacterium]